ncbi:hypothetical protein [Stackebrandtia soli]|uniref:hypothetical protein n=1 Tax=Stackebrandtia soli TaxID=1892856 RepID=UPI0039EAAE7D
MTDETIRELVLLWPERIPTVDPDDYPDDQRRSLTRRLNEDRWRSDEDARVEARLRDAIDFGDAEPGDPVMMALKLTARDLEEAKSRLVRLASYARWSARGGYSLQLIASYAEVVKSTVAEMTRHMEHALDGRLYIDPALQPYDPGCVHCGGPMHPLDLTAWGVADATHTCHDCHGIRVTVDADHLQGLDHPPTAWAAIDPVLADDAWNLLARAQDRPEHFYLAEHHAVLNRMTAAGIATTTSVDIRRCDHLDHPHVIAECPDYNGELHIQV